MADLEERVKGLEDRLRAVEAAIESLRAYLSPLPLRATSKSSDRQDTRVVSDRTKEEYSRAFARFRATGHPLTGDGVRAYLHELRQAGKQVSTLNIALGAIRLAARDASEQGEITSDDVAGVERIAYEKVVPSPKKRILSEAEVERLMEQVANGPNGLRNRALVACLLGCGLRRNEAVGLKWDNWEQHGTAWVWRDVTLRGGRAATLGSPDWVVEAVNNWRPSSGSDLVFPISGSSAYAIVRAAARRAGLGEVRPHHLRGTWRRLFRYSAELSLQQSQIESPNKSPSIAQSRGRGTEADDVARDERGLEASRRHGTRRVRELTPAQLEVRLFVKHHHGILQRVASEFGVSIQFVSRIAYNLTDAHSEGLRVERRLKELGCPLIQEVE